MCCEAGEVAAPCDERWPVNAPCILTFATGRVPAALGTFRPRPEQLSGGRVGRRHAVDSAPGYDVALRDILGAIAQLVERLNGIQEVRGSTPLGSTDNSP